MSNTAAASKGVKAVTMATATKLQMAILRCLEAEPVQMFTDLFQNKFKKSADPT